MTKKRFVNKGKDIFQYGEWWCSAGGEHCADVIATAMNELINENEQLKQEMGDLGTAHAEEINKIEDEFYEEILKLKKENEQLKKQLDETIEGLHKEITTSENAFEGLMNENKELRDACKNYDWYKLYNQLLNENEQLKELIKEKCPLCGCDLAHYYKVNGKLEDLE